METKYSARNEASLTKILHPLPVLQHLFTNESHLHRRTNRKTILNDGHRIFYRPVAVPTILFLLGESMAFSFFGERETNDLTAADARFIAAFIFFLGAMRGEVCP